MAGIFIGTTSNDYLTGTQSNDLIFGEDGSDTIYAGDGDDYVSGGKFISDSNPDEFSIGHKGTGFIRLEVPAKGSVNPVGMYKVQADGTITDVRVIWTGGLIDAKGTGKASTDWVPTELKAGERYGFFILSDGYGTASNRNLLSDQTASWELRDSKGGSADVNDKGLRLWHVNSSTGASTALSTSGGHEIFHSIGNAENGFILNSDGKAHAKVTCNYATGTITIGLESGKTGTPDFADAIITFSVGTENALSMTAKNPLTDGVKSAGHADYISGGEGNDVILGLNGNDTIFGDNGRDRIFGNDDNDVVSGGDGNDHLTGGKGLDIVSGGTGHDTILGNTGDDVVAGEDGNDSVSGNAGNDMLSDGAGIDTVLGGSGDDIVLAGAGDDIYKGDSGIDTLSFSLAMAAVTVNIEDRVATGAGKDSFSSFEIVVGSDFGDSLIGDKQNNKLFGGNGDDFLMGKRGNDMLSGGNGSDTFAFLSRKDAAGEFYTDKFVDRITDFEAGDKLDFTGFKLDLKKGIAAAVSIVDEADGAHVYAKFGTMGMVEIVVLEDVSGLDVTTLYTDGLLLV